MSLYESVKSGGVCRYGQCYTPIYGQCYTAGKKNKWHAGKSLIPKNQQQHLAMDQYLLIPFLGG